MEININLQKDIPKLYIKFIKSIKYIGNCNHKLRWKNNNTPNNTYHNYKYNNNLWNLLDAIKDYYNINKCELYNIFKKNDYNITTKLSIDFIKNYPIILDINNVEKHLLIKINDWKHGQAYYNRYYI